MNIKKPIDNLTGVQKERFDKGRQLYRTCMACHGNSGQGEAGVGASLAGSEWVQEDPEAVVRITLQGFSGGAEERGEEMTSVMPSHSYMSDEDIAQILTYIRQSWGNDASPIDPESVHKIREETKDRNRTWTPEELREVLE